jgi:hypothetical protein
MKVDISIMGVSMPSGCGIPSGTKFVFQRVRNGGAEAMAACSTPGIERSFSSRFVENPRVLSSPA